jgi:hypothetical protein
MISSARPIVNDEPEFTFTEIINAGLRAAGKSDRLSDFVTARRLATRAFARRTLHPVAATNRRVRRFGVRIAMAARQPDAGSAAARRLRCMA